VDDEEQRLKPPESLIIKSASDATGTPYVVNIACEWLTTRNTSELRINIACAMSQPILWTAAWNNLETLQLGEWIDASVANFYLLHVWYDGLAKSRLRYLDMYAAMAMNLSNMELDDIRKYHFIPVHGASPMLPVGFVVHHSAHFFIAIFDFEHRIAHVLGRHISDDAMHVDGTDQDEWKAWGGPDYWTRIAAIHGWNAGDPDNVYIKARNWEQNGVDCGPIACAVLEQVLIAGLDINGNVPPIHIQCGHMLRMKMFRIVLAQIQIRCRDYLMLLDSPASRLIFHDMPNEEVISDIQHGQHPITCEGLLETLLASSAICRACSDLTVMQVSSDVLQTFDNHHEISHVDMNTFENEQEWVQQNISNGKSMVYIST
jgi:hypothetical protein